MKIREKKNVKNGQKWSKKGLFLGQNRTCVIKPPFLHVQSSRTLFFSCLAVLGAQPLNILVCNALNKAPLQPLFLWHFLAGFGGRGVKSGGN